LRVCKLDVYGYKDGNCGERRVSIII